MLQAPSSVALPDFRAIVAVTPGACSILTPGLAIVAASDAFCALTHHTQTSLIGKPWGTLFLGTSLAQDLVTKSIARVQQGAATDSVVIPAPGTQACPGAWRLEHTGVRGDDGGLRYIVQRVDPTPELRPRSQLQPLILVVESDLCMTQHLRNVLTSDYRVITTSSADAGLREAMAQTPELILCDMLAPDQGGEALLARIRSERSLDLTAVVFLTSQADQTLRARILRAGAQDYVMKPFYADELRARLANLVATGRARQVLQAEAASTAHDLEGLAAEVAAQRHRAAFLAEVSRHLADSLDYDTTVQRIARLGLPGLADYCIVDVVDARRRIRRAALAHALPEHEDLINALKSFTPVWDSPQPAARVLRLGCSELLEVITPQVLEAHVTDRQHQELIVGLGLRTHMAVPLRAHGRTLGVMSFGGVHLERRFTEADLHLAEALAERAAFALDSARLYRDAQSALEARDDFLLVAAHELRTPLTSLLLQIHTLRRRAARALDGHAHAPMLDQRLDLLRLQCERLGQLIDAMLDVACIANGQFTVKLEAVDFGAVVRHVVSQLETSGDLARAHCELHVEASAKVLGSWDRMRLEQMLHHLLANALKYGAGQPVDVRLEATATRAVLTVRDTGLGIDPEAQTEIFERFARATSSRNYGGLGVGLYVVRQIAEAMGGEITVLSNPGAGATFTVALPRAASTMPASWPASAPLCQ